MKDKLNKQEQVKEFGQFSIEFQEIRKTLYNDLSDLLTKGKLNDQLFNRVLIQVAMTDIETLCYLLKQMILKLNIILERELTKNQIEFLSEERIIEKNGKIETLPVKEKFAKNVKKTLREYIKIFNLKFEIKDNKDWIKFREAVNIRHRITHPKRLADLNVTFEEYSTVGYSARWFALLYKELLSQTKTNFEKVLDSYDF